MTEVRDPEALLLLVTVVAAAKMLSVGRTTVYRLIEAGEIEAIKVFGGTRIVVASLVAYIERQRGQPVVSTSFVYQGSKEDGTA